MLATSPSISRTRPLARLSMCAGVNVELACELSKWCQCSAVEFTAWVLFNTAITPARNSGIGWEITGERDPQGEERGRYRVGQRRRKELSWGREELFYHLHSDHQYLPTPPGSVI